VLIGGGLTVLLGLVAVFVLPTVDRIVGDFTGGDLQRARADVRTSGLALATGVGAASAGLLAWGRLELSRRQHVMDRGRFDFEQEIQSRQHTLAEQSQRNERFARSVELLGHPDGSVRLGALYALEGLARDGFDRQTIYDVVSAYARTHGPATGTFTEMETSGESDLVLTADEITPDASGVSPEDTTSDDYEAALTICLRAPHEWTLTIDLRGTVIARRPLPALKSVDFAGASLVDCQFDTTAVACSFVGAALRGCRFVAAELTDCHLGHADLMSCQFSDVTLIGVSLDSAHVETCLFVDTKYDSPTTWPKGVGPAGTTHIPTLA